MKMTVIKRLLLVLLSMSYTACNVSATGCLKNRNINCYTINSNPKTWHNANNECKNKGGQLARINGEDLANFLLETYRKGKKTGPLWIGLKRCKGTWCYPDGDVSVYYNWKSKEPNNYGGNQDCVQMYDNGYWNDYPCDQTGPYICEMPYIDECSINVHNCHNHAYCIYTEGSFNCTCKSGYFGNGTFCNDIDECSANGHNCHNHANCRNTEGSFNCTCKSGYSGNGTSCIDSRSTFGELNNQVGKLYHKNISDEARKEGAQKIIDKLSNLTDLDKMNEEQREKRMNQKNLTEAVSILQKIVHLNISDSSLNILGPASNILDHRNTKSWRNMTDEKVIRDLVLTLENYGFQYGENLRNNTNAFAKFRNHSNVQLRVKYIKHVQLSQEERLFNFPNASFNFSPNALPKESGAVVVLLWYKTLHSFLRNSFHGDNVYAKINSKIISVNVRPEPKIQMQFAEPVRISWDTEELNESEACVYWKPKLSENRWKTDGCVRVKDNNRLICECTHLTAFASMDISRDVISEADRQALEMISTIGCSVSLLGVFLTILTHALLWKRLHKNAKTKVPSQVLMHLCVAIGMTDILAILAGPAQKHETFCIAVSILLYFFVLALFGWLLCEGIIIYLQLVNVYTGLGLGGKHLKAFYVIGWGIPVILVSVLVGVNDREDFITEHACWCRGGGVLFWTFVCTIGLILLINLVIFSLALRNALSSSEVSATRTEAGTTLRKAKIGLKGSAILLPILGLTWVFGLLVFNRDTLVFKYLFAIFNSLQGLMIFVFHVLINRKVHEAINEEKRARDARHTTYAMVKNNTCDTLSTIGGSPGKSGISVEPVFLEKISKSPPFTVKKKYTVQESDNGSLKPVRNECVDQSTERVTLEKIKIVKMQKCQQVVITKSKERVLVI